jgi:uncharacterized protein DUF5667
LPRWFSEERAESERFARSVEDPESGDDDFAAELALVGGLRELGSSESMDEETRRRIRAGIVERLTPPEPGEIPDELARRRKHPAIGGLLVAAAAVLIALGGLGMLLSKDALPGDPLYGVKRAGESTALGLTFGQQAKAEKHLQFADNRLDELAELKDSGGDSADYLTGLTDFEADARAGVAQLTALATANSGEQLASLRKWAQESSDQLRAESDAIPAAAVRRFSAIQSLLADVERRVTALSQRLGCYSITSGTTDELGALPADGDCDERPSTGSEKPSSGGTPSEPAAPEDSAKAYLPTDNVPSSEVPAQPTAPLQTTSNPAPPPVITPPILPTTGPRLPSSTTTRPPLISIPPLLPGLPPIVIP